MNSIVISSMGVTYNLRYCEKWYSRDTTDGSTGKTIILVDYRTGGKHPVGLVKNQADAKTICDLIGDCFINGGKVDLRPLL